MTAVLSVIVQHGMELSTELISIRKGCPVIRGQIRHINLFTIRNADHKYCHRFSHSPAVKCLPNARCLPRRFSEKHFGYLALKCNVVLNCIQTQGLGSLSALTDGGIPDEHNRDTLLQIE